MSENGIWHQAAEIIGTFRKTTALFPILALNVLLIILTAIIVPLTSTWVQIVMVSMLGLSVIVTIFQCIYFTFKDPDRLGTQSHILQRRVLDMLADQSQNLGTTASHIIAVINPSNPILPSDQIDPPTATSDSPLPPAQPQLQ